MAPIPTALFLSPTVLSIALSSPIALAQSVEQVVAIKGRFIQQTEASAPADSAPAGSWFAEFVVRGTDLEDIDPPRVTGPLGLGEPGHNNGFLGWNEFRNEWNYGAPQFIGWGVATQSELDSLFGSGIYTFLSGGNPVVDVSLEGDAYPAQWPGLDLSGGRWFDGRYIVDPRSPMFTVASATTWADYGNGILDVVSIQIGGSDLQIQNFANDGDPPIGSLEIPKASFQPGVSFDIESTLTRSVDVVVGIPGFPEALAGGAYESVVLVEAGIGKLEDLDLDGEVGPIDLGTLLAEWGACGKGCTADVDGDGVVGPSDLGAILAAWGPYF